MRRTTTASHASPVRQEAATTGRTVESAAVGTAAGAAAVAGTPRGCQQKAAMAVLTAVLRAGQTAAVTSAAIAPARAGLMAADPTEQLPIPGLTVGQKTAISRPKACHGRRARPEKAAATAAVSAATGVVIGPNVESELPATRPNKTLRWPIRPQWQLLPAATLLICDRAGSHKQMAWMPNVSHQRRVATASLTKLLVKAGVSGVNAASAMAAAMTGVAIAPRIRLHPLIALNWQA